MKPDAGCDLNLLFSDRKPASLLKLVRMLPYKTPLNQQKKAASAGIARCQGIYRPCHFRNQISRPLFAARLSLSISHHHVVF
ncbi:hypothetical protein SAMN04515618_12420 [Collimonas sp. OK307]|nr:hypothetical protein SAMN04515618_12420 [Collimonas sp. OK307]